MKLNVRLLTCSHNNKISVAMMHTLMLMSNKILRDQISNRIIHAQLKVKLTKHMIEECCLCWFRHVRSHPLSADMKRYIMHFRDSKKLSGQDQKDLDRGDKKGHGLLGLEQYHRMKWR